jgi:hypothetical protein
MAEEKINVAAKSARSHSVSQIQFDTSGGFMGKLPTDTNFGQQRMKAWQPVVTFKQVILIFALIAIVFIPVGAGIIAVSNTVVDYEARYDNLAPDSNGVTSFDLLISDHMKAPVYFYYKLHKYYQNHRRYVASRSDDQLLGLSNPDLKYCTPSNSKTTDGKTIYPCGIIASSFFNDSFGASLQRVNSNEWVVLGNLTNYQDNYLFQKKGVAWKEDVETKFKPNQAVLDEIAADGAAAKYTRHSAYYDFNIPQVNDEDFAVWMRPAGLPTFKKLHRIIHTDLNAGDKVRVFITDQYPVSNFNGQKLVVLSTTSALGGKNQFLGWAFIVVGILTGCLAILFTLKNYSHPVALNDTSHLPWLKQ